MGEKIFPMGAIRIDYTYINWHFKAFIGKVRALFFVEPLSYISLEKNESFSPGNRHSNDYANQPRDLASILVNCIELWVGEKWKTQACTLQVCGSKFLLLKKKINRNPRRNQYKHQPWINETCRIHAEVSGKLSHSSLCNS